jgi:hypothetical protein
MHVGQPSFQAQTDMKIQGEHAESLALQKRENRTTGGFEPVTDHPLAHAGYTCLSSLLLSSYKLYVLVCKTHICRHVCQEHLLTIDTTARDLENPCYAHPPPHSRVYLLLATYFSHAQGTRRREEQRCH